ncbi:unnamed protein product [Orchesella dallaii]|uniref:Uncharacterized protein n=1 Tax=Orchesella dallaii TaxID=48710 RepID=A0ABP1PXL5_9HEXA
MDCQRALDWNVHGYYTPPARRYLVHRTIGTIVDTPDPEDWLYAMNCSNCGFLVIAEYLLCVKDGHMTCLDCTKRYANLRCEFVSPIGKVLESRDLETAVTGRLIGPAPFANTKRNVELRRSRSYDDLLPNGRKCGAQLIVQPNQFITKLQNSILFNCPYKWAGCCEMLPASKLWHHFNYVCRFRMYNLQGYPPPTLHCNKTHSLKPESSEEVEMAEEAANQSSKYESNQQSDLKTWANTGGSAFLLNEVRFQTFNNLENVRNEENLAVIDPEEMDKEEVTCHEVTSIDATQENGKLTVSTMLVPTISKREEVNMDIVKVTESSISSEEMDKEEVAYREATSIVATQKFDHITWSNMLVSSTFPRISKKEEVDIDKIEEIEIVHDNCTPSPHDDGCLIQNESDLPLPCYDDHRIQSESDSTTSSDDDYRVQSESDSTTSSDDDDSSETSEESLASISFEENDQLSESTVFVPFTYHTLMREEFGMDRVKVTESSISSEEMDQEENTYLETTSIDATQEPGQLTLSTMLFPSTFPRISKIEEVVMDRVKITESSISSEEMDQEEVTYREVPSIDATHEPGQLTDTTMLVHSTFPTISKREVKVSVIGIGYDSPSPDYDGYRIQSGPDSTSSSDDDDHSEISKESLADVSFEEMDKEEEVTYREVTSINATQEPEQPTENTMLVPSTSSTISKREENVRVIEIGHNSTSSSDDGYLIHNESTSTSSFDHEDLTEVFEIDVTVHNNVVLRNTHISREAYFK